MIAISFDDDGRAVVFVLFVAVDLNAAMVIAPEEVAP
jgi:hypothetical protein